MTIAYDGTRYSGWQRQAEQDTVQQRLEKALSTIFGGHVGVIGAGRTDAGVHALAQAAHAVLPKEFPYDRLHLAINGNLPDDIAVRSVRAAPEGFHARFCAVGKRYVYRCVTSRVRPAIARGYYNWVRRPVDLAAMRRAGRYLVGRHDFAAFANNPGYERKHGSVRTIRHLHLWRRPWGFDLTVQGDGFLYNMVRAIAGTLVDVGLGRLSERQVHDILVSCDLSRAGATAPACGLYLVRVLYPDELRPAPACFESVEDVC